MALPMEGIWGSWGNGGVEEEAMGDGGDEEAVEVLGHGGDGGVAEEEG